MFNRKIRPTILVLISTILVFVLLLIYLNIVLFQLKKEKIETQSDDLISQAFFSIKHNTTGLNNYVNNIIDSENGAVSLNNLQNELRNIFYNYKTVSTKIDTVFEQLGLNLKYEWTITVPKFEITDSLVTTSLIDSKNKRTNDIVLYGKEHISEDASRYVFYKIGNQHFSQINLYIEFKNIYSLIARQLVAVLIADILLIILFTMAMVHSIKTLLKQQRIVTLQTDLLNAVSHEFNTPLSSIRIGGQALLKLKDNGDPVTINNVATGIIRQQQYLKNLVDQILAMGVSENRRTVIDGEVFRAHILVDEIVRKWTVATENEKAVELGKIPDCEITVDPHLIELALINIFDNSVKYAQSPTLQIKIDGELRKNKLRLSIYDDGPGIASADLKNVLSKFYRGKAVKEAQGSGLGLGLYLVNQIIKIHKGSCEVESQDGEGTKVIIVLPVKYVR